MSVSVVACLNVDVGVGGGVLGKWIRTFLVGRTHQVLYNGSIVIHRSTGFRRSAGFGSRPSPFPTVHCRAVRSHQQKGPGSTLIRWWYAGASQCTSLRIICRSSEVIGVHQGDRRLDAVKQTQNEHRQNQMRSGCEAREVWMLKEICDAYSITDLLGKNPADLDRNAPAAVKGRHQWDRTAAGWTRVVHGSDGPTGRVGSGRVGSGRVGSGRVGSGRVGSGRVGSGRVGSGRVTILPDFGGSGRVGSALRIFQCFTYYFLVPKSIWIFEYYIRSDWFSTIFNI